VTINFNSEQVAVLEHLGLADFDFERAAKAPDGSELSEQDDAAYEKIEWSNAKRGARRRCSQRIR
jgi:hypothetical protein